jgi:hypothetical protein
MRPIVAAPGEDFRRLVGQVDLDTVAIQLDVVNPRSPVGTFSIVDAGAGSTNPGRGCFEGDRLGFSALKHQKNSTRRRSKVTDHESFRNR